MKKSNFVKEAFSTMDVYLKKRWDLVPNLVEVVKEYAKQENAEVVPLCVRMEEELSGLDDSDTKEIFSSTQPTSQNEGAVWTKLL